MRLRFGAFVIMAIGITACGATYRDTSLFHNRIISEKPLPTEEYAVYSAALREFPPDKSPDHDWIMVTGVTIRPDTADIFALQSMDATVTEDMMEQLRAAGDTVYLVEAGFAESLNVAISPVLDTTDWVPVRWQRVRHRAHFYGLVSLSRVAYDGDRQTALVYGLWGTGTLGTGYPHVVLLRKRAGAWEVVSSQALDDH